MRYYLRLQICFLVTLASFLSSFLTTPTSAFEATSSFMSSAPVDSKMIIRPPVDEPFNFLGEDQSYSVTFRGNGEAVVVLKSVFSNLTDRPLSTLKFRVPKIDPKEVIVYQVIREPSCVRMSTVCEEYQEPNYYQYWYGKSRYQKAQTGIQIDTVVVDLPVAVKPNSSGSILFYYRALGYAKKSVFGSYDFVFESLKSEDKVRNLQVGISTDSDLVLKGGKGDVNYRFTDAAPALKSVAAQGSQAFSNSQFDNYYNQIGYGTIVKNASNLQPMESYSVKGAFADSKFKLYGNEISITLFVIVLVLLLLFAITRWLVKYFRKGSGTLKVASGSAASIGAVGRSTTSSFLLALGISFISAILAASYTIFLIIASRFFTNIYPYEFMGFAFVFLLLVSIGVYLVLILGPAIIFAVKRGVLWGLATFSMTIAWLVIFLVVSLGFVLLFNQRSFPGPIIPMMGDAIKSQTAPINQ